MKHKWEDYALSKTEWALSETLSQKQPEQKGLEVWIQVDCMHSKSKTLSSNSSAGGKKAHRNPYYLAVSVGFIYLVPGLRVSRI
jgi:hypothetical protein